MSLDLVTPDVSELASFGASAQTINDVVIHDVGTEIPDGIPTPALWRVTLMPVRQRKVSTGGIHIPDDILDADAWSHQLYKIAALGPHVYKGRAYQEIGVEDADIPKVGELWLVDPKQPRRFKYKDIQFVTVNDDQLTHRVDPKHVGGLNFSGFNL